MKSYCFNAVDDKGTKYQFQQEWSGNVVKLTLKKETFEKVEKLYILPEFAKAKAGEEGFHVIPRNIALDGDLMVKFEDREDMSFQTQEFPIMSCYCVKTPEVCALIRIERNYKYKFLLTVESGVYNVVPVFDFSDKVLINDPVYDDIHVEVVFFDENATLGDMAAKEREIRLERDEIIPLTEKCKRPAVEYARKYPLVRIRMGWKQSPSPVLHQTPETEPEMHAACTFARVRDIADAFKAHGIEGIELQLVGWNVSGHDGRFPQLFPADERLGGDEELKKTISYVKSLGYRISLHTNTIDAVEIADSFTWDDVVVTRQGEYYQCGHYSGGYAYHVCLEKQLKNAKRDLPAVAELGLNGLHFTDVISIVLPDSCHSKDHPCNTTEGIKLAQENIHYTSELLDGFSSEGCMDFALKELDYGLYVSFGNAFGIKPIPMCSRTIPFFEMVYHGIVLYNPTSPTINYPIKSKKDQLTFIMRGGRPSFYFWSKFRTGGQVNWMGEEDLIASDNASLDYAAELIAKESKRYEELCDLQLVYMKNYEYLDNGIEVASYCNGTKIVGNFTDKECKFEGEVIPAYDYRIVK